MGFEFCAALPPLGCAPRAMKFSCAMLFGDTIAKRADASFETERVGAAVCLELASAPHKRFNPVKRPSGQHSPGRRWSAMRPCEPACSHTNGYHRTCGQALCHTLTGGSVPPVRNPSRACRTTAGPSVFAWRFPPRARPRHHCPERGLSRTVLEPALGGAQEVLGGTRSTSSRTSKPTSRR